MRTWTYGSFRLTVERGTVNESTLAACGWRKVRHQRPGLPELIDTRTGDETMTAIRNMSRAEMDADRRKTFAAMARMTAMGWRHEYSVMDDSGTGGLFYSKGDRRFVMNSQTIDSLPND